VSESARRHHLEAARLRPEQVITLFNGIEFDPFSRVPDEVSAAVRAGFGIPPDAPVAVTVAVLREPKGLQYMIEALPRVAAEVPDVHYLIVGDGPHRGALEEAAEASGMSDRIVFAGSRRDVPSMLAAGDVFVLPSLIEALPTVLAEAGAAGLPVVATSVGGVPEMVGRNESALLVPPAEPGALAEAVTRLLTNPRQAAAMGRAGRRITHERFDVRTRVAALVDEYRHLIATRSR
jgi:glycosyltransferase involved in cell wall biosynthesis